MTLHRRLTPFASLVALLVAAPLQSDDENFAIRRVGMKTSCLPLFTVALVLSSLGLACSSGGTGGGSAESGDTDLTIHPSGSDVPGKLLVTAPAGAASVEKTTFYVGQSRIDLGSLLGPVPVGTANFGIETRGDWFSFAGWAQATIVSDQTTTITTGLAGVKATTGPRTLGLNDLVLAWGIPITPANGNTGQLNKASDGSKLAPLLAGAYEVNFGLYALDGIPLAVESGKTTIVTLTDTANRRVTRVHAPARDLPDATCGGAAGQRWTIAVHGDYAAYTVFNANDGDELDLGISPKHEGAGYTLTASAWVNAINVPSGDRGAGAKVWALSRLDITDVTVNGNKTVPGTYAIYPANAAGVATGPNFLRCQPPTNSGVDVPPGRYRVEIKYNTVEAGTKTDVHVVDVP